MITFFCYSFKDTINDTVLKKLPTSVQFVAEPLIDQILSELDAVEVNEGTVEPFSLADGIVEM